jgi:small GTP-binding protein
MDHQIKLKIGLVKCVLIGDSNAGKTSLCNKLLYDKFYKYTENTIGVTYFKKNIKTEENNYSLQLWDLSGNPRFRVISYMYLRDSNIVFVLFDLNNYKIDKINNLIKLIKDKSKNSKIILIGNKLDLVKDKKEDIKNIIDDNIEYLEISIKDNINIDKFNNILIKILDNLKKNDIKYYPKNKNKNKPKSTRCCFNCINR